jgi:hypothetical protein
MPKENFTCATSPDLRAEVRWKPDGGDGSGHVQIATVRTAEPVVTVTGSMPATTTTSGMTSAITPEMSGWFVDMDREQLNRMIRVLRRARDSAFGADA